MAEATGELAGKVRVMLMKSDETDALLELLRDTGPPDLEIRDKGTYWQLEAHREIVIDAAELSDYVGREMSVEDVLVNFATYIGRVDVQDGAVSVTAEFLQIDQAPTA